jgi:hypothetical protein
MIGYSQTAPASGWPGYTVGEYHHEVYKYVKAQAARRSYNDVVGNPGESDPSTEWQIDGRARPSYQAADELVVFEGTPSGLANKIFPSWINHYPASDIAVLIHADLTAPSMLSPGDYATICATLKGANVGLVDITPGDGLWTTLQDPTQFGYMRKYCG